MTDTPSAGAVAMAKATMLLLMPYWAIEGQPSDFPLAHQEIARAIDNFARETRWARDREWDSLLLKVFQGLEGESADPTPSEEKLKVFAREREAAGWEEAAKRWETCAGMARSQPQETDSHGYWAREGAYRAYKHVAEMCRIETVELRVAEARRTG